MLKWKNPFRMVETPTGMEYEAMQPDGPGMALYESHEVHTLVAIQTIEGVADVRINEPGDLDGTPVAKLPGLWIPPIGTKMQVAEPNRDVVVSGIRYQFDALGFVAIVYVSESPVA
jgi:hypothetical protein